VPTLTEVLSEAGIYSGITSKFHLTHPWKYQFDGRIREGSSPDSYASMLKTLIHQAGDKPFYIQVNVTTPHRPFRGHLKHLDGELPPLDEIEVPPFLADTDEMRKDLQEYYACVQLADQSVAAIIETLQEIGLYEDLLVIFTADQGMAYHRAKASPYYAGTHIPMIIRGPEAIKNRVISELVSLVDLMPTILDHLGVEVPASVQGTSLIPILSGEKAELEGRDYIFAEHNSHGPDEREWYPSRAIYDGRYYYIQNLYPAKTYLLPADLEFEEKWGNYAFQATLNARESHPEHFRLLMELQENRPPQELYDMQSDPGQLRNLAGYGKTEEVRKHLKQELEAWMTATGDSILQIMKLK
jgi:N-sulfoglucosamine sulfohydrolase